MTTKIHLFAPGAEPPEPTTVPVGSGRILIGRAPDAARAQLDGAVETSVRVPCVRVSSNHALAWRDDDGLHVRDLRSTHGTWVRVPRGAEVIARGAAELDVWLAVTERDDEVPPPREMAWRGRRVDPDAVGAHLAEWLGAMGMRAEYEAAAAESRPEDPTGFLLPDGRRFFVRPDEASTRIVPWPRVRARLAAWFHTQRARLAQEHEDAHPPGFVLASRRAVRAHREVVDAAARRQHVVLLGPSGSGRLTLSECYHAHREADARGALVSVDCAHATDAALVESLFGGARGVGAVSLARGGTLCLLGAQSMSLRVQSTLLGYLETGHAIGEDGRGRLAMPVPRVCTVGEPGLRDAVRGGAFREDLWYLLAGVVVDVDPLRGRPEDVAAYLHDSGDTALALSDEAMAWLLRYEWPGNFDELIAFAESLRRRPPARGAARVSVEACRAILGERALRAVPPARPRPLVTTHAVGWADVAARAAEAFVAAGDDPTAAEAAPLPEVVRRFAEEFLKPLSAAQRLGWDRWTRRDPPENFSQMAKQLGVRDGTSVKGYYRAYRANFRPDLPPLEDP